MKLVGLFLLCFFSSNLVYGLVCKDLLLKESFFKTSKADLKKAIDQERVADDVPGVSYTVFNANEILVSEVSGYGNLEETFELSPETSLFRTASVSKMVAAFAAAQLVESGKLDLEASILDYTQTGFIKHILETETLERIARWNKIKIKHLMTHQSGISKDLPGVLVFFNTEGIVDNSYPTMDDLFERLSDVEFLYEPGKVAGGSKYSNLAINLLALLVEGQNSEGLSFPDYVAKNIFGPLDMSHATYNINQSQEESLVTSYGQMHLPIVPVLRVGSYAGSIGFATSNTDLARLGQFMIDATSFEPNALLSSISTAEMLFVPNEGSYIAPNEPLASVPFWRVLPGNSQESGALWVGHTGTGY